MGVLTWELSLGVRGGGMGWVGLVGWGGGAGSTSNSAASPLQRPEFDPEHAILFFMHL